MSAGPETAVEPAEFDVGDTVVSPRHGPGIVVERAVRTVEQAPREYLTVELERRGITLKIPLGSVSRARLRPLSSRSEARLVLGVLGTQPQPLPKEWRHRKEEAVDRLGSGDLLTLAELVRDFSHAARAKRPAPSERELCQTARELLEAELTAVLGAPASREVGRQLAAPGAADPG